MDWKGPTWGQWADAVGDANRHIAEHAASAQQWMAYAKRLEAELDEVWDLYRNAKGSASGQRRLKEMALEELAKADPGNALLDPANRKKPSDEAKEAAMKQIRRE